jgi:hypothetical protein
MGEPTRFTSNGRRRDTLSGVHSACCESLLTFLHPGAWDLNSWCWQRAVFVRPKATASDHRPFVNRRSGKHGLLFVAFLAATLASTVTAKVHARVSDPARVWMPPTHVGAAITVGTMGIGLKAAVAHGGYWNIGVGVSHLAGSRTFRNGGSPFDAHLVLGGARLGAEWFPVGGRFHVSLGELVPNLTQTTAHINLQPRKAITIEAAQHTTDAADPVRESAHSGISSPGPLVSAERGNLIPRKYRQPFSFPTELGAVYEAPPIVQVTTSGDICPADEGCRPPSSDQLFNHNLATAIRESILI